MAQLPNLFDLLRGPQHDAVSVGVRAWRPAVLVSVNLYFPPAKVSFSRIRSHEIFNLSATVARASARHSLGGGARMTAGRVVINQRPPPLPRRVHSGPGTHRHNQLWEYFNMQWAKLSPECVFPLLAPRRRHSLGGGARTAASSVGISQFLFPSNKVSFSRKRSLQRRSVPRQGSRLSIKGVFPRQGSRRQTWTGRSTWDDRDCYLSNYRTEIAISRTCCLQRRSFSPAGFTEADLDRSMSSETHHRRRQRIRENETFVGGKGTLSDTDMAGFTEAGLDPSTSLSLQGRSRSLEYGFQPRSVSPAGFTEADLDRTMSSEIHRRWRQRSL